MSGSSPKMKELDKLQMLAPYPMNAQFVLGYLTFGVPL